MAEHVCTLVVTERDQLGAGKARAKVTQQRQGEDDVADAALEEDENARRLHWGVVERLP